MKVKILFVLIGGLFLAGCATGRETSPVVFDLNSRVGSLETENKALKEQVANLQAELESAKANAATVRMPTALEIQTALKSAGVYSGAIDGHIAMKTKEAISKFQKDNGLTADGVVGSRTWEKLSKYLK